MMLLAYMSMFFLFVLPPNWKLYIFLGLIIYLTIYAHTRSDTAQIQPRYSNQTKNEMEKWKCEIKANQTDLFFCTAAEWLVSFRFTNWLTLKNIPLIWRIESCIYGKRENRLISLPNNAHKCRPPWDLSGRCNKWNHPLKMSDSISKLNVWIEIARTKCYSIIKQHHFFIHP